MSRLVYASTKLLFIFLTALLAFGQQAGRLTGKVTNAQGQGVGQAEVRLKANNTVVQRATTAADGTFTFESLPPAFYSVEIESNGQVQTSVQSLEINRDTPVNVEMSFSGQTTVTTSSSTTPVGPVKLTASSPVIQASSAEVSRGYETRIVRSLPLIDRQNQELIGLMPGVTPPIMIQDRILDPQRSRVFNVNGLPEYANAYYQDGSYNVERFSGGQSRIAPNTSVQQLNVRTSNYNAEYGLSGGGNVNTVTRPGTNGIHGSAFYLNTNKFLTTRSPVNFSGNDPGFNVNQFGGSAGGAVVKDKTFWFLGYEGYLRRGSVLQIDTVPTADIRGGDFSQIPGLTLFNPATGGATGNNRVPFNGDRIPLSSVNPFSQAFVNALPLPNQPGTFNNLVTAAGLRDDQHRVDGKLDHRFTERSTGFLRYGWTTDSVNRLSQLGSLGNGADAELRNHNAVASFTQGIGLTGIVEGRVGWNRYRNAVTANGVSSLDSDLSRFGFANGLPQINIAGFGTYGLPGNYPSRAVNDNYDVAGTIGFHNGMHYIKGGVQVLQTRNSGFDPGAFSPRGSFLFGSGATTSPLAPAGSLNSGYNAFAAFLVGAPSASGVSSFQTTPTYRQTLTSAFLTDTINLRKNVHIELGVRYDVFSPLRTRNDNGAAAFDPTTNQFTLSNGSGDYDLNNVSPRVGIVVRPIERVAVRAGYSIQFFPQPFALSAINQAALAGQNGIGGLLTTTSFTLPNTQAPAGSTTGLNPNQPLYVSGNSNVVTPYVHTYSLMIQGDLGNGILLDVGYVGNGGRQLPYNSALNFALPGTGLAGLPFTQFGRTAGLYSRGNGLNSSYNSLQVNLTKRFGAGLSIAGAYTYGKALDRGFDQANPLNFQSNYGPADWDRTHILAISHLWQLPFGPGAAYFNDGLAAQILGSWQINGILRWATGTPYSVFADPLTCNCPGITGVRAVPVDGLAINGSSSFNPASFSAPAAGTLSSIGRNLFRGPDMFTYDVSVFRRFPVRENFSFELRAEAYNLTNNTNLVSPVGMLTNLNAGTSVRTFNNGLGRQFQLGGRILF